MLILVLLLWADGLFADSYFMPLRSDGHYGEITLLKGTAKPNKNQKGLFLQDIGNAPPSGAAQISQPIVHKGSMLVFPQPTTVAARRRIPAAAIDLEPPRLTPSISAISTRNVRETVRQRMVDHP